MKIKKDTTTIENIVFYDVLFEHSHEQTFFDQYGIHTAFPEDTILLYDSLTNKYLCFNKQLKKIPATADYVVKILLMAE